MALRIYGKLLDWKVAPVGFDHSFFEGRRPGRHAIVKIGIGFGAGQRAGAVAIAHGSILDDIVLIRGDGFALFPDRSTYATVGVDGIIGPVATRIRKVKST